MTDEALKRFIESVPKVELHVHLEGSIPPETFLCLAEKNGIGLPFSTPEEARAWYAFRDFPHFAEVYHTLSRCIASAEDIETVARDFVAGQAAQGVIYTEMTYTALTQYKNHGILLDDQLAALRSARQWAEKTLNVSFGVIVDIPRDYASPEQSTMIAEWVAANAGDTLIALGLGGYEVGFPPEQFAHAFAITHAAGVPAVVHAGETEGPKSVWGALNELHAVRIGHGVRSTEDPILIDYLRGHKIVLEVCPSSNVCLGVYPSLADHSLPVLMEAGIPVTINSDDPPMFGTTLLEEYARVTTEFGFTRNHVAQWIQTAADAVLCSPAKKAEIKRRIDDGIKQRTP